MSLPPEDLRAWVAYFKLLIEIEQSLEVGGDNEDNTDNTEESDESLPDSTGIYR